MGEQRADARTATTMRRQPRP